MSNLHAISQPRRVAPGTTVVNDGNASPVSTASATTQSDIPNASLIQLSPRVSVSPVPSLKEEEAEEKRCWICYTSEAEEEVPKSDWKSPCQCTLVAHESCLLEWIADLQRPENSNNLGGKIACPQCKTQIRLKEQRSLVLDTVEGITRVVGRAVPVLLLAGVGSVVFVGCTVYGVNTIYAVCGPAYANQILLGRNSEFAWTWRLGIGLPLIPFVLVASRTRTFESALPVLPLVFFCHSDPLYLSFPPSPAITLAVLPYLRGAYNSLWSRFISPYEDRWIKDVTPAYALENAENRQAANQNINNQRRQENVNGQQGNRQAGENGELGAEAAVNGNRWEGEVHLENHNIIIQGSNITNMILGALLWPSVARMVGESVLGKWPKAWGGDVVRKLLPEGVVRNVVGGLMAVVLKDFISLYCKYKRAQQFRTRKVMDYSDVKKEKEQEKDKEKARATSSNRR